MSTKITIQEAIQYVSSRFEYTQDKKSFIDPWFVMKERTGRMQGDCDDYTFTVLWLYFQRSIFKFIFGLLTGKAKIHRVMSKTGWHIVGQVGEVWFDNWTMKPMQKDDFFKATKHQYKKRYYFLIPYFAISGLFKR